MTVLSEDKKGKKGKKGSQVLLEGDGTAVVKQFRLLFCITYLHTCLMRGKPRWCSPIYMVYNTRCMRRLHTTHCSPP